MEDTNDKAKKFDSLSRLSRIAKIQPLVRYLRQRALHYYSYGSENRFNMYAAEFNEPLTIQQAREKTRPNLEDRITDSTTVMPMAPTNVDLVKPKNSPKVPYSEKPDADPRKKKNKETNISAEKKAQMDVARKLKLMGVEVEVIHRACQLLTIEEIMKL